MACYAVRLCVRSAHSVYVCACACHGWKVVTCSRGGRPRLPVVCPAIMYPSNECLCVCVWLPPCACWCRPVLQPFGIPEQHKRGGPLLLLHLALSAPASGPPSCWQPPAHLSPVCPGGLCAWRWVSGRARWAHAGRAGPPGPWRQPRGPRRDGGAVGPGARAHPIPASAGHKLGGPGHGCQWQLGLTPPAPTRQPPPASPDPPATSTPSHDELCTVEHYPDTS